MFARGVRVMGAVLVAGLILSIGAAKAAPVCKDATGKSLDKVSDLVGTKWVSQPGDPVAEFKDAGGALKLDWPIKVPNDVKPDATAATLLDSLRVVDATFDSSHFIRFIRSVLVFSDKGAARESFKLWYELEIGSDCQSLFGKTKVNNDNNFTEGVRFNRQN